MLVIRPCEVRTRFVAQLTAVPRAGARGQFVPEGANSRGVSRITRLNAAVNALFVA